MAIEIALYFPKQVLTNEKIASWGVNSRGKLLTPQSIYSKVGVRQRYVAEQHETVLNMGTRAVLALRSAAKTDVVFFSTSYPNGINNASELAQNPSLRADGCINVHAACSGFTLSLSHIFKNRDRFSGKKILLVASERYSPTLIDLRSTDTDPSLAQTIFSDGAAAVLFTEGKDMQILNAIDYSFPKERSVLIRMPVSYDLVRYPALTVDIPVSENGHFLMDGKAVYEGVREFVPCQINEAIAGARLESKQIKMVIPHQASRHMIDALAKRLPDLQIYSDLEDGNWSSASIPKAMLKALKEGAIAAGDKIVLAGFGAGMFASVSVVQLN